MLPAITAAFPQDLTNSGIAAMQNVLIHPTRNKQDKKIRREQGGVIDPVQSRKLGCTIRWLVHFSQAQTHMGFQFRRFRLLWRNTYRYTHSTESTATHTQQPRGYHNGKGKGRAWSSAAIALRGEPGTLAVLTPASVNRRRSGCDTAEKNEVGTELPAL